MANAIQAIKEQFADALDEKFIKESVTGILEGGNDLIKFIDAKTVLIPDMDMSGLGDYDRAKGFPEGDIDLSYTPYQLAMDRGREFSIDAVSDEEAAGVFSKLSNQFFKQKVIPEVDAYRLTKLLANAASANISSDTSLTSSNIISKLNADAKLLEDQEVPTNECVRFVSTEVYNLMMESDKLTKMVTQSDYELGNIKLTINEYNDIPFIKVPLARFYSNYTFGTNGFAKTDGAVAINWLTVHRNAAICIKKHEAIRVFSPDVNQDKDAWKFQYRLHHDILTPKNKQVGISASTKGAYTATINADGSTERIAEIEANQTLTA